MFTYLHRFLYISISQRGSYISDLRVGLTSDPIIFKGLISLILLTDILPRESQLQIRRRQPSARIPVPPCHGGQIFNLDFFSENRNTPIIVCLKGTKGAKRSQQTIPLPASSHLVCFIAQGEPCRTIWTLLWSARGENRNIIVTCLYFKICKGISLPISKLTFWGWNIGSSLKPHPDFTNSSAPYPLASVPLICFLVHKALVLALLRFNHVWPLY